MIKAAFVSWDSRISPVFDVARQVHIVEAESGKIVRETQESLPEDMPMQKALRLAELGVDTLVCGAISRSMQAMIAAHGIRIIPFVAGDLRDVIYAWLSGVIENEIFTMPGCRGKAPRHRFQDAHAAVKEEYGMNGRNRGGAGQCRRQGRGGKGRGRKGGPSAVEPGGFCVCPQCGRREPHERSVPCMEKKCPECGVAMTKQ